MAARAFGITKPSDRGRMLHYDNLHKQMRVKFDTYSGCIYKTAGLKKKVDTASHGLQYFEKYS